MKTTVLMRENIDLIGISMNFDLDFIQVLAFLEKNNYAFKSIERDESAPLIFAGGAVITSNPEPYKNIFDFFVIGDGEEVNSKVVRLLLENRNKTKSEKLSILSGIEGVYVPNITKKVVKSVKKLSQCVYTPIISSKSFFKDTFIIEVERGCANRCAFCLASYNNLPIRFLPYQNIIEAIDLGLKYTNKIALLGAQVTAHPDFDKICEYLHNKIKNGEQLEISVSSLRVDAFRENIVKMLVDAGQRHLTLAIEAGSERLRKVVNKNVTNAQIFNAVEVAKKCGLKGIKFYAMLGIPTENKEDVEALILLARDIKSRYKGFDISFGFSTFVPKPNTPFQWFGREDEKSLEKKINYVRKSMHKIGVQTGFPSLKWDYWQAVLSRGDEKLTDFLIEVYKQGAKLGAFKKVSKELNIDSDFYAIKNYDYGMPLPWDFITLKPGKEFLVGEAQRCLAISESN